MPREQNAAGWLSEMAQDGAMLGIGDGLDDGRLVGTGVGLRVGPAVGAALVVNDVGCFVGAKVGVLVGAVVGADRVGNRLRIAVGPAEGSADGPMVGLDAVGPQVGASVGANVVGDTVGDDDAGGCVGTLLGSDVDGDEVGGRVQPKQVNRQLALKIGLVWQREGPSPSWGTLRWHSRPSLGAISTGIAVCSTSWLATVRSGAACSWREHRTRTAVDACCRRDLECEAGRIPSAGSFAAVWQESVDSECAGTSTDSSTQPPGPGSICNLVKRARNSAAAMCYRHDV